MKPLDHGVLNIPLRKRFDIDKEIDRYKAEQRKLKKKEWSKARDEYKAAKIQAKILFNEMDLNLIKIQAEKNNVTPRELISFMKDMCNYSPLKAIKLIKGLFIKNNH
jgi:hypothetical protein